MKPEISILINNYNYAEYLEEAISSALNQTYPHTEVIVVDDGSTDGSKGSIEKFGDRLRAVFKEHGGQASAFNSGVEAARGEILLFLDAADTASPERAETLVGHYNGLPESQKDALIFHLLEMTDKKGNPTGEYLPRYPKNLKAYENSFRDLPIREEMSCFSVPEKRARFFPQVSLLPLSRRSHQRIITETGTR